MSENLKAIAARIPSEIFSQGKVELIDEIVDPEFVDHGPPMPGISARGRDGMKQMVAVSRQAFPDLTNTVNHMIAEGDFVALHVTSTGTMTGAFAGMPPSGKQATWDAMHFARFRDGKLIEHWVVPDQLGMLQQLGFVQVPGLGQPAG